MKNCRKFVKIDKYYFVQSIYFIETIFELIKLRNVIRELGLEPKWPLKNTRKMAESFSWSELEDWNTVAWRSFYTLLIDHFSKNSYFSLKTYIQGSTLGANCQTHGFDARRWRTAHPVIHRDMDLCFRVHLNTRRESLSVGFTSTQRLVWASPRSGIPPG